MHVLYLYLIFLLSINIMKQLSLTKKFHIVLQTCDCIHKMLHSSLCLFNEQRNKNSNMAVLLLLMIVPLICDSTALPCSRTVSINDTSLIIFGPCPSDIVIAPVNSTVNYICDYVVKSEGSGSFPFWNLSLPESPFFIGSTGTGITVHVFAFSTGKTGQTLLEITVKDLEPVNIQCGVCLPPKCVANPLKLGIISSSRVLIPFGSPCCLNHSFTKDLLLLSWKSPLVSENFDVLFEYKVSFSNSSAIEVFTLNTTNTFISLKLLSLPNMCFGFTWKVSAKTSYGKAKSPEQRISSFNTPRFVNEVRIHAFECDSSYININLIFSVSSHYSPEDLKYLIIAHYTGGSREHVNVIDPTAAKWINSTVLLQLFFNLPCSQNNSSLILNVNMSNECGYTISNDIALNVSEISQCISNGLPVFSMASSGVSDRMMGSSGEVFITPSSSTVDRGENKKNNDIWNSLLLIAVPVIVGTIFVIAIILIALVVCIRRRLKVGNSKMLFPSPTSNLDTPADYTTPAQAKQQCKRYAYSEPEPLKTALPLAIFPLTLPAATNLTHSTLFEEIPGYSEVFRGGPPRTTRPCPTQVQPPQEEGSELNSVHLSSYPQ